MQFFFMDRDLFQTATRARCNTQRAETTRARMRFLFGGLISVLLLAPVTRTFSGEAEINQLSAREQKAGWKLLFNGKSLDGWRNYKKADAPTKGWVVEDGILKLQAKAGGGDIVTAEQFTNFDLRWEWRMAAKANNGLKYLVSEKRSAPGPEYQMIDDSLETEAKRMTASLYDILPPNKDKRVKPFGQWNQSRILVRGRHVEHWLNGKKVLAYELGSPELKEAVAQSKFKNVEGFAEKSKGHIMLTDHHDAVSFRNLKLRELP